LFYFVLAAELGMSVNEIDQRISSKEITEWMAFFHIRQVEEKMAMNKGK